MHVYILKLKHNKWYIGMTKQKPSERIQNHIDNKGSEWTKKHNVEDVYDVVETEDELLENITTIKYMSLYGIQNVRGGAFCSIVLPDEELMVLEKIISSKKNVCYRCGRSSHFIADCYANTHVDGYKLNNDDESIEKCTVI